MCFGELNLRNMISINFVFSNHYQFLGVRSLSAASKDSLLYSEDAVVEHETERASQ